MTDAQIQGNWTGLAPLRIDRNDALSFITDHNVGNGGLVRVSRTVSLDASDEQILFALKDLAEDALISVAAYPPHLAKLGKLTHGDT